MGLLVVLLVVALVIGGVGLAVEALRWLLIIALLFLIAGAVAGFMGRGRTGV